jgi:hypothetical protein
MAHNLSTGLARPSCCLSPSHTSHATSCTGTGHHSLFRLLLQVLLHHPLADVGALRRLLQQLAEETQRRMEGRGVDMGTVEGRKAVGASGQAPIGR